MIRFPWRRAMQAGAARPHADNSASEAQAGSPQDPSSGESGASRPTAVRGERNTFIASRARSLQSRVSSLLAAGLMISVGAGMLAWYYARALSRPVAARTPVQVSVPEDAGEGMTLPAFGALAPPLVSRSAVSVSTAPSAPTVAVLPTFAGGQASPAATLPLDPLLEPPLQRAGGGLARDYVAPQQTSPRQQALERRLSGGVFAAGGGDTSSNTAGPATDEGPAAALPLSSVQPQLQTSASGLHEDALQTLLRPSVLTATRAEILPTQRLLLPKGTFVDCTLETAIDSTLPGMTTCITATDTFGADGTVVLLERGTKLIGETRGEVHQGDARVFIVWTEARTPSGVVVRLDSPGTDALGRSGLDGKVNRHFWQRFGAAALVSTIDGLVQSEVQSSSRSGTVVFDPTASEDVLNDILRGTVNIPPTIRVRNGARIQVLVARDVDFRPVYELEPR